MSEFELEYLMQIHSEEVTLLLTGWLTVQFAVITGAYFLRNQARGFIQWFLFFTYSVWTFLIYGRLLLVFDKINAFQSQLIAKGLSPDVSFVDFFVVGFGLLALLAVAGTYVILFNYKFSEIR